MDTIAKQRMTVAEFLAWAEARPEGRYELVKGKIVRMPSERARHNLTKAEVWMVLRSAIQAAGLPNTVYTDGMGVVIDGETTREPDAIVAVGSVQDHDSLVVDDPQIIVEVVSPSSEATDRNDKLAEYFTLPTVEHYLLVWPEQRYVEHFRRSTGASGTLLRPGAVLRLDPPGIAVGVTDLLAAAGG